MTDCIPCKVWGNPLQKKFTSQIGDKFFSQIEKFKNTFSSNLRTVGDCKSFIHQSFKYFPHSWMKKPFEEKALTSS